MASSGATESPQLTTAHRVNRPRVATMTSALADVEVAGVKTNRALLARLVADSRFKSGNVTTNWLEQALA